MRLKCLNLVSKALTIPGPLFIGSRGRLRQEHPSEVSTRRGSPSTQRKEDRYAGSGALRLVGYQL
jgi:hypothetical protein